MKKLIFIGIGCLMYVQLYAQLNLDSGLVGYYPFDGNAQDESGFNFNGAVTGAVLTADRFGHNNSAYYFDGYGDRIEVANTNGHFNLNYLTVSAWVKPDSYIREFGSIVYKNAQTGYNRDNYLLAIQYINNNSLKFYTHIEEYSTVLDDNSFRNFQPFSDMHTTQEWYLVTSVYDSSGVSIYVNAKFEDSVFIQNIVPWKGPAPLLIGSLTYSTHPNGDFHGIIDDVRIYNRPLSATEISALYNQANGIFETEKHPDISFYPNPVTDVLMIKGIDNNTLFSVFSTDGKLLIQKTLKEGTNSVNLNDLDQGVLIIQLRNKNEIISERIIKQ